MRHTKLFLLAILQLALYGCSMSSREKSEKENDTLTAQTNTPAPMERKLQKYSSILWEISKKGMKAKSYLLGTVHIVDYHFLDTLPKYQSIVDSVDAIFVEHDGAAFAKSALDPLHNAKANKYPSYAFMPKGVKHDANIYANKGEYSYVEYFIRKFRKEQGAPKFKLEDLKPIYVMMILKTYYMNMGMLERTFSGSLPVDYKQMDMGIGDEAQKQGKRLLYLETLDERHDEKEEALYIDTCNLARQGHLLYLTCKNLDAQKKHKPKTDDKAQSHTNKMIEHYMRGELDTLYKSVERMTTLPPDVSDDYHKKGVNNLVAGRNKNWIPVIKSNIKQQPCLIAVGTGHLPGKEGLINLLRKEGYTVEPVNIYEKTNEE